MQQANHLPHVAAVNVQAIDRPFAHRFRGALLYAARPSDPLFSGLVASTVARAPKNGLSVAEMQTLYDLTPARKSRIFSVRHDDPMYDKVVAARAARRAASEASAQNEARQGPAAGQCAEKQLPPRESGPPAFIKDLPPVKLAAPCSHSATGSEISCAVESVKPDFPSLMAKHERLAKEMREAGMVVIAFDATSMPCGEHVLSLPLIHQDEEFQVSITMKLPGGLASAPVSPPSAGPPVVLPARAKALQPQDKPPLYAQIDFDVVAQLQATGKTVLECFDHYCAANAGQRLYGRSSFFNMVRNWKKTHDVAP